MRKALFKSNTSFVEQHAAVRAEADHVVAEAVGPHGFLAGLAVNALKFSAATDRTVPGDAAVGGFRA